MSLSIRLHSAARAALLHFSASLLVVVALAWLIFGLWFPGPLGTLANGLDLFLILIAVDVICGPVLTFVLYDPEKSNKKWLGDLGLIVFFQLMALVYGLSQVASARPVFVAFEGDRFRIVQAIDVNEEHLIEAPAKLQSLGYLGPKIISARLADPEDKDYLASLQMSIQGNHPSFRPSRWQNYDSKVADVVSKLKPINDLRDKNPDRIQILEDALARSDLSEEQLGYLPLVRDVITDWVVIVERSTGAHLAYLNLDGW